jgi:hypothetical protein
LQVFRIWFRNFQGKFKLPMCSAWLFFTVLIVWHWAKRYGHVSHAAHAK